MVVAEVCPKMGISEAPAADRFYNWKEKYGSLGVPELRRLRQFEEEKQQLKQLVADLSLYKQMLQEVIKSFKASSTPRAGSESLQLRTYYTIELRLQRLQNKELTPYLSTDLAYTNTIS